METHSGRTFTKYTTGLIMNVPGQITAWIKQSLARWLSEHLGKVLSWLIHMYKYLSGCMMLIWMFPWCWLVCMIDIKAEKKKTFRLNVYTVWKKRFKLYPTQNILNPNGFFIEKFRTITQIWENLMLRATFYQNNLYVLCKCIWTFFYEYWGWTGWVQNNISWNDCQ